MSENDKRGLAGWLGLREPFDYSKARWLGPVLSGLVFLLFILAIASAVRMLGGAVFGSASLTPGNSLGVGAVTVALIGAPFVIWRSVVAQKSVDVQEQGQITDRINKAVEGLGAEKTVRLHRKDSNGNFLFHEKEGSQGDTKSDLDFKRPVIVELSEPNLEVRIGAIYALERISQDSARDHIQIMEILCAYIRQNAGREDVPLPKGEPTPEQWQVWAQEGRQHLRLDVDVALKVIDRRGAARKKLEKDQNPPYRLGLERAPLRKIILSLRDLTEADLTGAQLQGAVLRGAQLQRANLAFTELQAADLRDSKLQGANLEFAKLQGAYVWRAQFWDSNLSFAQLPGASLWKAQLQGADLENAQLQGANLMGAHLQRANLSLAELGGANLCGAQLQGAYLNEVAFDDQTALSKPHVRDVAILRGAAVRQVDFSQILQFRDHVKDMFGDASVTLPGGHGPEDEDWPAHWPRRTLGTAEFKKEWRRWQDEGPNYKPPKAPEEG